MDLWDSKVIYIDSLEKEKEYVEVCSYSKILLIKKDEMHNEILLQNNNLCVEAL
jgi:hypothetical protein